MLIAFVMQKSQFRHVQTEVRATWAEEEVVQERTQQTPLAKETMIVLLQTLTPVVGTRYDST